MTCLTIDECHAWRDRHARRHEWKCQLTCVTPPKRLPAFTAALVGQLVPFDRALLIVDQVATTVPRPFVALRQKAGERRPVEDAPGHAFDGDAEAFRACLEAVLSGGIDFRVLFSPPRHAFRADHDEYATLFSQSPGKVADWREVVRGQGERIVEYTAKNP